MEIVSNFIGIVVLLGLGYVGYRWYKAKKSDGTL